MGCRTILAVLDTPRNAAQIADFALSLAAQFSAHVIGVHAETLAAVPLIAPMEIPDPAAVQVLQEAARRETGEVERIFNERIRLASGGAGTISSEWRSFVTSAGYSASSVMETARSVDLIVARQNDPAHAADNRADLESFLFESGRPMLLVPYTIETPVPVRRVLIGWNGSREAARATFDALPFLMAAESVEVFCVNPPERVDGSDEMAGIELAATLARHGIRVTLTTEKDKGLSPSAAIEKHLSDNSVDLLVMGAYSHSRWWELLFGGVTRNMLSSMTALSLLPR